MKRSKTVPELVKKYKQKYPNAPKSYLRRLIRAENKELFVNLNGTEKSSEVRKLSRYLKQAYENQVISEELPRHTMDNTTLIRKLGWSQQKVELYNDLKKNGVLGERERQQKIQTLANGDKKKVDVINVIDSLPETHYYNVKLRCKYCGEESTGTREGQPPTDYTPIICPKCNKINDKSSCVIKETKLNRSL
jgi:hypothetical protein